MIAIINKQVMRDEILSPGEARDQTRLDPVVVEMYQSHRDHMRQAVSAHQACYKNLKQLLNQKGISYTTRLLVDGWYEDLCNDHQFKQSSTRLVISFGGDGTFLQVAAAVSDETVMVLGLKSTEYSVGALCAADESNISQMIDHYIHGAYNSTMVSRVVAKITSLHDGSVRYTPPAVNELLYTHSHPGSAVRYVLMWDNQIQKQVSSGMWIYTRLGSTAAAQAAGAQVSDSIQSSSDGDHTFGFLIREPYGSFDWHQGRWNHSLVRGAHPEQGWFQAAVLPADSCGHYQGPTLVNLAQQAQIVVDGRHSTPLYQGDQITVEVGQSLTMFAG